jgi:hypothetical protein
MLRLRRGLFWLICVLALSGGAARAQQADMRSILGQMIYQLQTGAPNPTWYGPELWSTICAQTGCTGYYAQLAGLGAVQRVDLNASAQLPAGAIYSLTAHQANGNSQWIIGVSRLNNRIIYANFCTCQTPYPLPAPQAPQAPNVVQRPDVVNPNNDNPAPLPQTVTESEACRKFPNLCQ